MVPTISGILQQLAITADLQAWTANIDIQSVLNNYKAVTYMCAYFSKTENETSETIKEAIKEADMSENTELEKMRAVAKAYSKKWGAQIKRRCAS